MADPRAFKVYFPIPDQNDIMIIAAALAEEGRAGVEDMDGNLNRSVALRLLVRDRKKLLQQQPSPAPEVSLWDYIKQGLKAQGKLPWPDKAEYDKESANGEKV